MGILRGVDKDSIIPLAECIVSSGLKTVEITMNAHGAPELIRVMVKAANNRFTVGAGTVLSMDDLHRALDSGATFIVSPVLIDDVLRYCVKNNICVFPGALTPQEIYKAVLLGATMVKVFPARFFGPEYFKELKGPFNNVELLACGGVNLKNIGLFFSYGAAGVAFGGSIFKKEWLSAGDFFRIQESIKALIESWQKSLSDKGKSRSKIFS